MIPNCPEKNRWLITESILKQKMIRLQTLRNPVFPKKKITEPHRRNVPAASPKDRKAYLAGSVYLSVSAKSMGEDDITERGMDNPVNIARRMEESAQIRTVFPEFFSSLRTSCELREASVFTFDLCFEIRSMTMFLQSENILLRVQ